MSGTATEYSGRRLWMKSYKSGNLPIVGTGMDIPDHEDLIVPEFSTGVHFRYLRFAAGRRWAVFLPNS